MKKYLYLLILSFIILSCKKHEKDQEPEIQPVVNGVLYGVPFTAKVVIERLTNFRLADYKTDELFNIFLSANEAKSCGSANSEFSIRLTVPRKIGTYSENDTYVLVNDPRDPTGQDGVLFPVPADGIISITSITPTKIIGQVNIKWSKQNIDLKGRFEANICQ